MATKAEEITARVRATWSERRGKWGWLTLAYVIVRGGLDLIGRYQSIGCAPLWAYVRTAIDWGYWYGLATSPLVTAALAIGGLWAIYSASAKQAEAQTRIEEPLEIGFPPAIPIISVHPTPASSVGSKADITLLVSELRRWANERDLGEPVGTSAAERPRAWLPHQEQTAAEYRERFAERVADAIHFCEVRGIDMTHARLSARGPMNTASARAVANRLENALERLA
jgi:hypothetical protein